MRPRHALLTLATLLCGAAALPAPARADDASYDVVLTRPDKVGDRFKVESEGARIRQNVLVLKGERKEQPAEGMGIKLVGTVHVLAATPKGRATKLEITVEKCTRVSGADESELLAPGKVIVAEAAGQDTKFSLKDGELPEPASEALELLFQLSDDDKRGTDDELFGVAGKQKVGATWQMSAEQASKDFAAEEIKVEKSDISGSVKLEAVERVEGVECLKLTGRMTAKNIQPAPAAGEGLPPGFAPQPATMDYKFTIALPTDPKLQSVEESVSTRHKLAYGGNAPGGQEVRTEVTVERAARMKRTPVK